MAPSSSPLPIGAGSAIGARATAVKEGPSCSVMVGRPGRLLLLHLADPRVGRPQALEWGRFRSAICSTKSGAVEAIEGMAASGAVIPYRRPMLMTADPADPDQTLTPLDENPLALEN